MAEQQLAQELIAMRQQVQQLSEQMQQAQAAAAAQQQQLQQQLQESQASAAMMQATVRNELLQTQNAAQAQIIGLQSQLQEYQKTQMEAGVATKQSITIAKPSNLKDQDGWSEFRHAVETYLNFVDKSYKEELSSAANPETELSHDDMGDRTETRSIQLYAMLSSWTSSNPECRVFSKSIKDGNGYLLWQRLVQHFEPKVLSKGLIWRRQLQNPTFPQREEQFQLALLDW
jgi:hypothetical protein